MKKQIFKTILILGIIWLFVSLNLKSNAIYYAAHMPKGKYRVAEAMMAIDNMESLSDESVEGYRRRRDGYNILYRLGTPFLFNNYRFYKEGSFYTYRNLRKSYFIDKQGSILREYNHENHEKRELNFSDQKQVYEEIQSFIQPIVDKQDKPIINLQWLFNLLNDKRFND